LYVIAFLQETLFGVRDPRRGKEAAADVAGEKDKSVLDSSLRRKRSEHYEMTGY
jgi:hypothetical protein